MFLLISAVTSYLRYSPDYSSVRFSWNIIWKFPPKNATPYAHVHRQLFFAELIEGLFLSSAGMYGMREQCAGSVNYAHRSGCPLQRTDAHRAGNTLFLIISTIQIPNADITRTRVTTVSGPYTFTTFPGFSDKKSWLLQPIWGTQ